MTDCPTVSTYIFSYVCILIQCDYMSNIVGSATLYVKYTYYVLNIVGSATVVPIDVCFYSQNVHIRMSAYLYSAVLSCYI